MSNALQRPSHRYRADGGQVPDFSAMLPKCNISGTVNAGRGFGVLPTSFEQEIVENSDAVPISGLRRTTQGNSMIDPEVARLRRLRSEALLVREVARTLASTPWAAKESLLDRTACASWRIARIVSGRLRSHPYAHPQEPAARAESPAAAREHARTASGRRHRAGLVVRFQRGAVEIAVRDQSPRRGNCIANAERRAARASGRKGTGPNGRHGGESWRRARGRLAVPRALIRPRVLIRIGEF